MIWDFIRDFFVQFIFGGVTSEGVYYGGLVGRFANKNEGFYDTLSTSDVYFGVGEVIWDGDDSIYQSITLGDWLSTTATIIVMCLIVFLLICLVRWIFRAVSSAMLLK